jgi:hypothetical protein
LAEYSRSLGTLLVPPPLSRVPPSGNLLLCAKHLLVEANRRPSLDPCWDLGPNAKAKGNDSTDRPSTGGGRGVCTGPDFKKIKIQQKDLFSLSLFLSLVLETTKTVVYSLSADISGEG